MKNLDSNEIQLVSGGSNGYGMFAAAMAGLISETARILVLPAAVLVGSAAIIGAMIWVYSNNNQ